ncbi:IS3 family transposase [Clostridioides difficile]|uniref:IS3 family transposase n=1 Tax=Clostridioides difficile TaxID=1496 RepID=UPI0010336B8A|nr:IS3 family transposase [Clostridioides difficile]EGT5015051.1 IS3 family transposase [Clostridioides difficile]MBY2229008.1 IS3 family transposase [Clostridioides difficile]HBF4284627.1 IS3 family transposase [Clostridioides difficile]HBF5048731.1 IS3 family transposase [Clostridioides difficile]
MGGSRKEAITRSFKKETIYITIKELNEQRYPISVLCDIVGIARSSYYKWLNRLETSTDKENSTITKEILRIYNDVNGIYGYRRMTMNVNRNLNKKYNYKRIYCLMKSLNLQSVIRKKRKKYVKCTPQITAENILDRDFSAATLNEKWLTDVTEFKLSNGTKAYLSAIIDLYDNSIVSYVLGNSNNNKLVFDTFDLAIESNPSAKPLFHSDRGYQYTSKTFKLKLDNVSATQSMSRVGRCIDNGPIEGFWGIIKSEMYYLKKFNNFDELKLAIDDYIEFYNKKRLQRKLKGLSPIEYRTQTLVA